MIPAYIIHKKDCSERIPIVNELIQKTNAKLVKAIYYEKNGKKGCRESHTLVANSAKSSHPNSYYLVFEDDCVLLEGWEKALENYENYDIIYLGCNDVCVQTIFGTHALLISPKVRDLIIQHTEEFSEEFEAFDWILSAIIREYRLNLKVMMPNVAIQKEGVISLITGKPRNLLKVFS